MVLRHGCNDIKVLSLTTVEITGHGSNDVKALDIIQTLGITCHGSYATKVLGILVNIRFCLQLFKINDFSLESFGTLSLVEFGIKLVTWLRVDNVGSSFTLKRVYTSTVHMFRCKLEFGLWFSVIGNLSKTSFFLLGLVWGGRAELLLCLRCKCTCCLKFVCVCGRQDLKSSALFTVDKMYG